jgi:hypothetical protein
MLTLRRWAVLLAVTLMLLARRRAAVRRAMLAGWRRE